MATAAAHQGLSISTLVRKASLARARRIVGKSERKGGPDPTKFSRPHSMTYLLSLAREARQGGVSRHFKVGFEAARFTPRLLGRKSNYFSSLRQLQGLARRNDLPGIFSWYERVLPSVAKLPPTWRTEEFAEGVRSAWASGDAMLRPIDARSTGSP